MPGHATHAELPAAHQPLWTKFCEKRRPHELAAGHPPKLCSPTAASMPSSAKSCASVGKFYWQPNETLECRVKSYVGDDECEVLRGFARALGEAKPHGTKLPAATGIRHHDDPKRTGHYFCAHNGREFDYGYLGRRMLVCGIPPLPMLDVAGYKGWDLPHLLDTMNLWKFSDFKGAIALSLLEPVMYLLRVGQA